MLSQSNMSFAWLDDTTGLYRAYPGAVFLQNQVIFNIDPFLNILTQASGKHHFRTRVLFSDNQMTANQSNRTTTYYGDYMFQKTYPQLKGIDFIGGVTASFTDSYASMYAGGGSPNNELFNLYSRSHLSKLKNTSLIESNLLVDLKTAGIAVEPMDTGAACRTFNVLIAEDRRVAAALIPVG